MDEMTFWESMQERWQAYKKPILIAFWFGIFYDIFGAKGECGTRHCPLPADITAFERFLFFCLMSYSLILPLWITWIWIKRKYETDGHLD